MKTQIPVYRAKKIDSEDYVIGFLYDVLSVIPTNKDLKPLLRAWIQNKEEAYEVDPSTLSIHFPDMIAGDSDRLLPNGEKDLRIFASLSKDGKGGDILLNGDTLTPIIFKDGSLKTRKLDCLLPARYLTDWEITGVQK